MFPKLSRYDTIEKYGLCGGELMPADEWEAYEDCSPDDPDDWLSESDEPNAPQ